MFGRYELFMPNKMVGMPKFISVSLEFEISSDGIVSQSYDGTSVMLGKENGLQALISEFCNRFILYVHCFLHTICLVVVQVMDSIDDIKEYFSIISSLHKFFKKSAVLEFYEGSALKRLIETRWSGHYGNVNHVHNNYGDLIKALEIVSQSRTKKVASDDRTLAHGLLHEIEGNGNDDIVAALSVVNAVMDDLKSTREVLEDETCAEMVENYRKSAHITNVQTVQKRNNSIPSRFNQFIVLEPLPSENVRRSKLEVFAESLDLHQKILNFGKSWRLLPLIPLTFSSMMF